MAVSFQLVIDCADPEPLARFWAAALGYELEPPPDGFLAGLGAMIVGVLSTDGLDHYAVAMKDPEGNEFDIN